MWGNLPHGKGVTPIPLAETKIRNAKPGEKQYKLSDSKGLFLIVTPQGGKWWRMKYRYQGREKTLSLGVYPEVGLANARERRDEARKLLANGVDPSEARKAEKAAQAGATTFKVVAEEWFARHAPNWAEGHAITVHSRLERDVYPGLGDQPMREIEPPQVLELLRRIEGRGALVVAHRVKGIISQVFRYAIATGRADRDPTADLRGALPPVRQQNHPAITDPRKIGELLRAIEGYAGSFPVCCALKLAPVLFVRPGELRRAEWTEFDLEWAEWRIPPEKMKRKSEHIVPLPRQALTILEDLYRLTGHGRYVFPSIRSQDRPMSENTVNAVLRRLGFTKEEMTGHGFRSMASTTLYEHGWSEEAVERQLAHTEENSVRAAYDHAKYLPERRQMMQWWANHLDQLRGEGGNVVPLFREPAG